MKSWCSFSLFITKHLHWTRGVLCLNLRQRIKHVQHYLNLKSWPSHQLASELFNDGGAVSSSSIWSVFLIFSNMCISFKAFLLTTKLSL